MAGTAPAKEKAECARGGACGRRSSSLSQVSLESTEITPATRCANLGRSCASVFVSTRPVSVTTADVPGPPVPVYLAGARLLEVFPVIPLISRVSLGVGALSYAEQFTVMAVADPDACPDLDVFAAGVRDELQALAESTWASPRRR